MMRSRGFRGIQGAALAGIALAAVAMPGFGRAQTAPRYQSPVKAPQLQLPTLPTPVAKTSATATVVEDVVVRVNDQVISRTDVEQAQELKAEEMRQQNATPAEIAQGQKDTLRDMIDQQLLLSKGTDLEVNPDAEVVKYLDNLRKQNNFETMEELQKAVTESGRSYEDFKKQIRDKVITDSVIGQEVARRIQPTQAQVQAYYDEHKNDFAEPEQVDLSEILIPTPADASDAILAQAQAKAEEVAAKVKAGALFDEMAKQYSGGPTASQGGELGLFKRGPMGQVLDDATFSLPAGGVTAPIRTRQGFVILKVTQHIPAGVQPLKDVEQQVMQAVYVQAMEPALRTYLTKLREDASIFLKAGYVDSAASPNELNPDISFTAYMLPAPKKKVVVQKARLDRSGHAIAASGKAAAPVATPAAAVSGGTAAPSAPTGTVVSGKKPKKVKREKVRFGQAPRTTLGAGAADETVATDSAAAATSVPGDAMAPAGNALVAANTVDPNVNPLEPQAPPQKKTRFAKTEPYHGTPRPKKLSAMAKEKAIAKPTPLSTDEKQTQQVQAAPLGLNGDTAKKKTKPKKVKGTPKERLKEKPVETPAPVDQTVNPAVGAPLPGTTPIPPAPAQGAQPPAPAAK